MKSIQKLKYSKQSIFSKNILMLVVCVFLFSCKKDENQSENVKLYDDYKELGLNNNVKSVKVHIKNNPQQKNDEVQFKSSFIEQYFFNENGQLIQKKILLENGSLLEDHYYEGKDQLVKLIKYMNDALFETTTIERNTKNEIYIITKLDHENKLKEIEKYEYQNDLLSRKIKLDADKNEKEKITYEYSNKQLLETEKLYGFNNALKITKKYTYNENDLIEKQQDFNNKDEIVLTTIYTYSDEKELELTAFYNSKNQLVRSEKKKYDELNRLIYFAVLDETGQKITTETKYNEDNLIIGYDQFENDILTESLTYVYNTNGLMTQILDNLNRDSEFASQYEYVTDEQGNWIKKTTTMNGVQFEIVEREILYN